MIARIGSSINWIGPLFRFEKAKNVPFFIFLNMA